jgi:metal-sulfur cluster biosynthetic enzyme
MDSIKEKIIENLRQVYDPEISINVYDLGLIYEINIDKNHCNVIMTLTSAFCPAADYIISDVHDAVCGVENIETCDVEVTFDPPFGPDRMSEEVKIILGVWE